jgi:hypothetical protein
MLGAAHLRAKAGDYRITARAVSDARTRELYLAVAKYLDDWAAQAEAKEAASRPAPPDRQAV